MTVLKLTKDTVFLNALRTRIIEQLDKDFNTALPEWVRVDVETTTDTDIISGRLLIRIDFLFDPNGLS